MTFGREPFEVLELDVDYCPLTYGSAPCQAVLGTTGQHKCFNTYETCQNVANFGRLAEPDATPDEYDDNDTIPAASYDRTADFFWAADLEIPSTDPAGCIWELGGGGDGLYVGFTSGELVFRAGNGGAPGVNTANLRVDASAIYGQTGTLYGSVDVPADTVRLWWYHPESRTLTSFGSATASSGFTNWAGTGDGEFGGVDPGAGYPSGESAADFNGVATKLRLYDSTIHTPTTDGNTLTLRYCRNRDGIPHGTDLYLPFLQSVSGRGGEVNLGGANPDLGSLGRRERVTATLLDAPHHDRGVDKYALERRSGAAQASGTGYKPEERSTHFVKLVRRWPHYHLRPARVRHGVVGQALGDMTTRRYVITEWAGPSPEGAVSITLQDPLALLDDDNALCPTPTDGTLAADMTATDLSFTLALSGDGDQYAASGRVSIGQEVMTYTRSGDTFTITARGVDGTEATTHSAGDGVQECYRCENAPIEQVLRELIRDYAGVDGDFISYTDWQAEASQRWLAGFDLTRTIPKPTGVKKLVTEIVQLGVMLWWDPVDEEIRLRANRPVESTETIPSITDDNAILAGSLARNIGDEKRLTRVILCHGQIDVNGSTDDPDNYRRFSIATNPEAASRFEYAQEQTLWIYSPWLGAGNDSVANPVALRTLNRYTDPPKIISFTVTSKDRDSVDLAKVVSLTSRLLVTPEGEEEATQLQITSLQDDGESLTAKAESFAYSGRYAAVAPNGTANYASATAGARAIYGFIVGSSLEFGDGTGPYLVF